MLISINAVTRYKSVKHQLSVPRENNHAYKDYVWIQTGSQDLQML